MKTTERCMADEQRSSNLSPCAPTDIMSSPSRLTIVSDRFIQMNGSDEVDLRNLYARAHFARRKRNADDDAVFDLEDIFDEDEVEEIKRVNKGPRPGG